MNNANIRNNLIAAENFLLTLPNTEFEVVHHFSPGIYARELHIPAGFVLTGKIHKTEHLCIVHGDILIESEQGGGRYTGYHTFTSNPGVKRIGRTFADTIFTTIHATWETDIARLESNLAADTYAEYEQFLLSSVKTLDVREDYERFLIEYGFSAEAVKAIVEKEADQIPMPAGFGKVEKRESAIDGQGLFVTVDVEPGDFLAPARLSGKRTPAGRYTNHSPYPNAAMHPLPNGDIHLIATHKISSGNEILIDYRQAGSVNGNNIQSSMPEMIDTVRNRFVSLGIIEDDGIKQFTEAALDKFGYLPSMPSMLDMLGE